MIRDHCHGLHEPAAITKTYFWLPSTTSSACLAEGLYPLMHAHTFPATSDILMATDFMAYTRGSSGHSLGCPLLLRETPWDDFLPVRPVLVPHLRSPPSLFLSATSADRLVFLVLLLGSGHSCAVIEFAHAFARQRRRGSSFGAMATGHDDAFSLCIPCCLCLLSSSGV